MAAAIESGNYQAKRVFKDNRHNYAALIEFETRPGRYVLKVPRGRNQRTWQRLISLARPSESLRQFQSFSELERLGFAAPTPIAAGEHRSCGRVTHSYLLYEFAEGRPATPDDAAMIARELRRLHSLGYTRRDPKCDNFLINGDQVIFIDFRLTRHRWLQHWHTSLEFAHALHTMPKAIDALPASVRHSLLFRLLFWYRLNLSRIKKAKRRLLGRDI